MDTLLLSRRLRAVILVRDSTAAQTLLRLQDAIGKWAMGIRIVPTSNATPQKSRSIARSSPTLTPGDVFVRVYSIRMLDSADGQFSQRGPKGSGMLYCQKGNSKAGLVQC